MISSEQECKAWDKDQLFVGVDEAGLGCVAGSCFVGLAIFPKDYDFQVKLSAVNDSKQLTENKRNELAAIIKEEAQYWDVRQVSPVSIDAGSAYHLRFDAAREMVVAVYPMYQNMVVCMDGNKAIPGLDGIFNAGTLDSQCLVKGDTKSFTIAAASILAKTEKDKEMHRLHDRFPMYNFASNKGYASKEHRQAIQKHGLCDAHRKTFCTKFTIDS